jgi:hypothetical protein
MAELARLHGAIVNGYTLSEGGVDIREEKQARRRRSMWSPRSMAAVTSW